MKTKTFTSEKAKQIGSKVSVDWKKVDLEQFRIGLETEMEHGTQNPATNVTDDNELTTAKIALAHLAEIPDYYTRLQIMERKAVHEWDRKKKVQKVKAAYTMNIKTLAEDFKKWKIKLEQYQNEIPFLHEQLEMLKHGEMKKNILKHAEKYKKKLDMVNEKNMAIINKCLDLEGKIEKEILTGKTTLKRNLLHEKQKLEKSVAAGLAYFETLSEDLKGLLHTAMVFKAEHATF